jgi:hypothetical protein
MSVWPGTIVGSVHGIGDNPTRVRAASIHIRSSVM